MDVSDSGGNYLNAFVRQREGCIEIGYDIQDSQYAMQLIFGLEMPRYAALKRSLLAYGSKLTFYLAYERIRVEALTQKNRPS